MSVKTVAPLTLDPDAGDLRPVAELLTSLTGRRPSPPTVWRWCVKGTRRAGKLPAVKLFNQWHSNRKALLQWLAADSERPDVPTDDEPGPRDTELEKQLQTAGLI